jgi:hypothetical protein
MRAPDYTWADLIYYGGLGIGGGITYFTLQAMGVRSQIILLIAALIVGVGVGYLLEKAFRQS